MKTSRTKLFQLTIALSIILSIASCLNYPFIKIWPSAQSSSNQDSIANNEFADIEALRSSELDFAETSSELPPTETKKIGTQLSAIEIEWAVPKGRVTKYLLKYGVNSDELDQTIEINADDLASVPHEVYGSVYRYLLSGISASSIVNYTLQAGNERGFSNPTPVSSVLTK